MTLLKHRTKAHVPGQLEGQGDLQRTALESVLCTKGELGDLAVCAHLKDLQVLRVQGLHKNTHKHITVNSVHIIF